MTTATFTPASKIPSLPIETWPPAERAGLTPSPMAAKDPFAKKASQRSGYSPVGEWRPAYLKNVRKAYGKWLGYLQIAAPERLRLPPAERVTPEFVSAYIAALEATGVASSSRAIYLVDLLAALRVLAKEGDWRWLAAAAGRARRSAVPVRSKHERILPVRDLYRLGKTIMREARALDTAEHRAHRYRDGLIIALWAARPWRLANFAGLDVDKHLVTSENAITVVFDASETKEKRHREWPLPEDIVPDVKEFLGRHRGNIRGAKLHRFLWPSPRGGRMSDSATAGVLARETRKALGVTLHPHAVRYSAATSTALAGAGSSRIVMAVLGHATLETSEEYYILAKTIDAQRKTTASLRLLHQELLEGQHRPPVRH